MGLDTLIRAFTRVAVKGADDVAPLTDNLAATAARETAELAGKKADDVVAPVVRKTDDATVIHPAGKPISDIDFNKFKEELLATVAAATKQPGFWGRSNTRAASLALMTIPFAAYTGFGILETQTKGAATSAIVEGVSQGLRAGIKAGTITAENLESSIAVATAIHTIYNWVDKSAQNTAVQGVLTISDNPDSPETIARAKDAALLWIAKPDSLAGLIANMSLRAEVVDDAIPNRQEADKFLAESLINNIVEKSEVWALGNNQVTRDDVKAKLATLLSQDTPLNDYIKGTRLENGLRQIWPDIFVSEEPSSDINTDPATTTPGVTDRFTAAAERLTNLTNWQKKFEEMAESAKNIQGIGWILSPLIAFAAAIIGLIAEFFKPESAQNVDIQTADGGKKITDVARALGQGDVTLPNVNNHDGKPQKPIVIDGVTYVPAERQPALNAGMVPQ